MTDFIEVRARFTLPPGEPTVYLAISDSRHQATRPPVFGNYSGRMRTKREDKPTNFERVMVFLMGLAILSPVIATFAAGETTYTNRWGGMVFAPVGIIFGVAAIILALFPSLLQKKDRK
jgi:hypothetical protein